MVNYALFIQNENGEHIKMKPKIFIDGQEGTTGLQIHNRLVDRNDIELLSIEEALRKDICEKKRLINQADLVILCLPDVAARESVSLINNDKTKVIDASTAHRTNADWVYGFAELSQEQYSKIKNSKRVANPGCHSTGIIASVFPLISQNIMPNNYPITCMSITGYSGGGKSMINAYENEKTTAMYAPRIYALELNHKHLPEIMYVTGLTAKPLFCPIVDDYYNGLATTVALHNHSLPGSPTAECIHKVLVDHYKGQKFVSVAPELGSGMLECNWGAGTDNMEITVSGNDDQTIITARFDNLGKGASGAAVQNMDIMLELS